MNILSKDRFCNSLLSYKEITYFPMTYYDCRYLGLEIEWDSQRGLAISSTGVFGMYRDYGSSGVNSRGGVASIVNFPVRTSGVQIDNEKEDYPLLLFRNLCGNGFWETLYIALST